LSPKRRRSKSPTKPESPGKGKGKVTSSPRRRDDPMDEDDEDDDEEEENGDDDDDDDEDEDDAMEEEDDDDDDEDDDGGDEVKPSPSRLAFLSVAHDDLALPCRLTPVQSSRAAHVGHGLTTPRPRR